MTPAHLLCLSLVLLQSFKSHSGDTSVNPRFLFVSSGNPQARAILYPQGDTTRTPLGTIYLNEMFRVVIVKGYLTGLTPGLHGFHIHQNPELTDNCAATGPHYNPFEMNHGGFFTNQRHVGDLGNILTGIFGNTLVHMIVPQISLSMEDNPTFVVGRSIVVHANKDDLGKGGNDQSLLTGNAGGRVACGVIELV